MKDTIKQFIFSELIFHDNPANFSNTDDLFAAGLDSMGIMRLTLFIENHYQTTIPDEDITPENLQSIDMITACVKRYRNTECKT